MLEVLHVTPAFAPAYRYGGPIQSLEGLISNLPADQVRVRVLTTDADGPVRLVVPEGWHRRAGVEVRYMRRWAPPDLAPALAWQAFIGARRAHVVHVTSLFSAPSAAALIAAAATDKPTICSPRGALQPAALVRGRSAVKRTWIAALRTVLERSVFHATSEAERDAIRAVLGPVVVEIIPNGADLEGREQALRRRRLARSVGSALVVGAMGRIHPLKGLDRLIEAVALLRARGVDIQLRAAGPAQDAEYANTLRSMVGRLGLGDIVTFVGEVRGEAKRDFFAASDVVVVPSHSENFGNVVVESLAAFTPVIASLGTPWRALETNGAGIWTSNSPTDLANAIEQLSEPAAAARAGAAGRDMVEREFTWQAVAKRMLALYHRTSRLPASPR